MSVNLYIVILIVVAASCLVIWLVYLNLRDEKKFERDIDEKDDLTEERERKETEKPL